MKEFETVEGTRLALDLRSVRAILERDRGIQLITSDDLYMVKGEFNEIVKQVREAKEGVV